MTQHDKLLNLLRGRDWVPLYEVLQLNIAQYGTRIHELKKRGYIIENHLVEVVGGQRRTAFRLVYEPTVAPTMPRQKPQQLTWGIERKQFTNAEKIS
jgi:hypothetical protein